MRRPLKIGLDDYKDYCSETIRIPFADVRGLAAAVISRAIRDSLGKTGISKASTGAEGQHQKAIREAKEWLREESNEEFSSNWWFSILALNKAQVLEIIKQEGYVYKEPKQYTTYKQAS